jgi:hypothetical protein
MGEFVYVADEVTSMPGGCPFCAGIVPSDIVVLRATFQCPSCGKALKVNASYEWLVRLLAVASGFTIAYAAGFRGPLLFCLGFVPSPFLLGPVFRAIATLKRPSLVPAAPNVTTLDLGGR